MLHVLDVARTLRRDQEIIESELNKEELFASLRERLLAAAEAAGDNVSPDEVDAAIEIYFDSLHTYSDPPWSFSIFLAHLYVRRRHLTIWLGVAAGALMLGWFLFWSPAAPYSSQSRNQRAVAAQEEEARSTQETYNSRLAAARSIAQQPEAIEHLDRLAREGDAATAANNLAELEKLSNEIADFEMRLREEYEVVIVTDPDQMSAVIRDFDDQLSGYYIVVEARAADGRKLPMDITNRETDETEHVVEWGELVPSNVFERIRQDKQSDGVLDERVFALKRFGWIDLDIVLVDGDGLPLERRGQITEW